MKQGATKLIQKSWIYLLVVAFILSPLSGIAEDKASTEKSGKTTEKIVKTETTKPESKTSEIAGAEAGTAGTGGAFGLSPVALTGIIVSTAAVIYVAADAASDDAKTGDTGGDLPVITTTVHH